nr:Ubiquitin-60S ribosomal protein L40 [Ipomoea batatas]
MSTAHPTATASSSAALQSPPSISFSPSSQHSASYPSTATQTSAALIPRQSSSPSTTHSQSSFQFSAAQSLLKTPFTSLESPAYISNLTPSLAFTLSRMLCSLASPCCQLSQKEVWAQQSVEAKEEDQVDFVFEDEPTLYQMVSTTYGTRNLYNLQNLS